MTSGDGMRRRGFTLIELLVVLAIIATLLSLAMPQYFRQQDKARETVLRHNLVTLRKALDDYRDDRGKSPESLDELVQRRYLRELPLDPLTTGATAGCSSARPRAALPTCTAARPARRMTGPTMQAGDRHSRGSVYIGALVALAILGVMLSQFGVLWATQDRRAREADLLAHGNEIRRAIGAYYDANPAGQYPKRLDELVLDPRQPVVARYLRRAWRDPLPKGGEWGIVPGPDNGIVGVYSQAPGTPLRVGGFTPANAGFADKGSYQEWIFVHQPEAN